MAKDTGAKIDGRIVTFNMGLKRDSLDMREYTIAVTVDCTAATETDILAQAFAGSSARVKLQTKLRKLSEEKLSAIEASGYKTTLADILAEGSAEDKLKALSRDAFVKYAQGTFGVDVSIAGMMYNNLHK